MTELSRAFAIVALGAAACTSPAPAAEQDSNSGGQPVVLARDDANNAELFSFDFGVPTSPALFLIGSSTDKSSPSTALKPFVFQLPATYGGAKDSQAFALDFAPAWALDIPDNDFDHYAGRNGSYLRRLENRTRLGVALFPGSNGNGDAAQKKSSRLAVGLSASLLDDSDPLATLGDSGETVWSECLEGVMQSEDENKYVEKFTKEINKDWREITVATRLVGFAKNNPDDAALVASAQEAIKSCVNAGACAGQPGVNDLRSATFDTTTDQATKLQKQAELLAVMEAAIRKQRDEESEKAATEFKIDAAFADCATKANVKARRGYDLDIGLGALWRGQPGQASDFEDAGVVTWGAFKIPLTFLDKVTMAMRAVPGTAKIDDRSESFMLGGSLRASWDEFVQTGDTAMPEIRADVLDAWIGLERFSADTKLVLQGGYSDFHANDPLQSKFSKSGFRWQVSGSVKLDALLGTFAAGTFLGGGGDAPANGVWVNASYGAASGTTTTLDDKMFLVSLSFSPTLSNPFGGGGTN